MSVNVVVCVVAGHCWTEHEEAYETFPVLLCTRCGRATRASELMDGRIKRRP